MLVSHRGNGLQINDIPRRITDRFTEDGACLVVDQSFQTGRIVVLSEAHFDTLFGQHMGKQGIGPSIEQRDRHNIVAFFCNRQDGVIDRRTAGTDREAGDSPIQFGDPLFQDIGGGIHDARVDVPWNRQIEQIRPMLGIVKFIGNRLIDGNRNGFRRRVGLISAMNSNGFRFHFLSPSGSFGSTPSIKQILRSILVNW